MTRRWLRRPRLCGHAWARLHVRASSTEKRIGSVGSLASTAPFSRPSRSPLLPWFPGCPSAPPGRVCLCAGGGSRGGHLQHASRSWPGPTVPRRPGGGPGALGSRCWRAGTSLSPSEAEASPPPAWSPPSLRPEVHPGGPQRSHARHRLRARLLGSQARTSQPTAPGPAH